MHHIISALSWKLERHRDSWKIEYIYYYRDDMSNQEEIKKWSFETRAVHAGQDYSQWKNNEMVPPIVTSMTFYQNDPSKMAVRKWWSTFFFIPEHKRWRQIVPTIIHILVIGQHLVIFVNISVMMTFQKYYQMLSVILVLK